MAMSSGIRPPGSRLATAALLATAAVAGTFQLRSTDFFWHLVSGRWILEHRAVPDHDPFRFTSDAVPGGVSWVDHEWLFQVLLALGERSGGVPALQLARTALVTGLAALLLAALRGAGAPAAGTVAVVLAALLGARPRFLLRPELASMLGLVLLLTLLARLRRRGRLSPGLAAGFAALAAVWANLHPGVLAAPPLAAAFLLGARLPGGSGGRRGERPVARGTAGLVLVLVTAPILLNPSGWRLFTVPLTIGASLGDLPGYNPEWQPVWADPQPLLLTGLAALLAVAVAAGRRTRRLDPATGLVTLALLALALASVRHQGLFFLGAAFFAGECLGDLAAARQAAGGEVPRRRLPAPFLAALACLLAAAWCLRPPPSGPLEPRQRYEPGLGLQPGRFPEAAVSALAAWPGISRTYHDGVWGGYLLWRLYPPRKIFLDGRNEVNPDLLREVGAARRDSRRWRELLDRHHIDSALARYDERPVPVLSPGGGEVLGYHTVHALLFPSEEFALVYFDDLAMLFVRRTPDNASELSRREYRHLHPEDWRASLVEAAGDPGRLAALAFELDRRLGEEPPCRRAERLRAALRQVQTGHRSAPPTPR